MHVFALHNDEQRLPSGDKRIGWRRLASARCEAAPPLESLPMPPQERRRPGKESPCDRAAKLDESLMTPLLPSTAIQPADGDRGASHHEQSEADCAAEHDLCRHSRIVQSPRGQKDGQHAGREANGAQQRRGNDEGDPRAASAKREMRRSRRSTKPATGHASSGDKKDSPIRTAAKLTIDAVTAPTSAAPGRRFNQPRTSAVAPTAQAVRGAHEPRNPPALQPRAEKLRPATIHSRSRWLRYCCRVSSPEASEGKRKSRIRAHKAPRTDLSIHPPSGCAFTSSDNTPARS